MEMKQNYMTKRSGVGEQMTDAITPLVQTALMATLIGPPTIAGYLGYHNAKVKGKLEKDKEFEIQKRMSRALDEAIKTTY